MRMDKGILITDLIKNRLTFSLFSLLILIFIIESESLLVSWISLSLG